MTADPYANADLARSLWAEFDASRVHATVRAAEAHLLLARQLAETVPHLIAELDELESAVAAVRRLTSDEDHMYELPDDVLVTVAQIRAALDGKATDVQQP